MGLLRCIFIFKIVENERKSSIFVQNTKTYFSINFWHEHDNFTIFNVKWKKYWLPEDFFLFFFKICVKITYR